MAGNRFWLQSSLSVVLIFALVQVAAAQGPYYVPLPEFASATVPAARGTCKVYSLSDLGDDPKLCKWIADTIPQMIHPASWKQSNAKIALYAPAKILVISNTPAVHAQVDEFLQNMKKSVAQSRPTRTPGLLPAQFAVPDTVRAAQGVQTGPGGYPVPMPPQTPKHLFHFIIRYEGEGIIDSNVVRFAKAIKEATEGGSPQPSVSCLPTVIGGAVGSLVGEAAPARRPGTAVPLPPGPPQSNAPQMPPADAPPSAPPGLTVQSPHPVLPLAPVRRGEPR